MQYLELRIEGVSPILMHSPLGMVRREEGVGVKHIPTAEEEAEAGAYRFKDSRQLYAPSDWFRQSGLNACRGRRIGKVGAAGKFAGGVFLTEAYCGLVDPETGDPLTEYEVDVRRCVVQRQGIMRARPRVDRWATKVVFENDPDIITDAMVVELMTVAGKISGVGDYRVGRGGSFGRYRATLTKIVPID